MPDLFQAMDTFILPSIYEGLPVTCIEAQANGLPCILSDNVSPEAVCNPNTVFISLKSVHPWAETIVSCPKSRDTNLPVKKLYNIRFQANRLEALYLSLES